MLGIILAGGLGSRLNPITQVVSKQLLPIYDKPMIFYPLSLLMASGIRDLVIITNPEHKESFNKLLGNGERWGIEIEFLTQDKPKGLPDAFIVAQKRLMGKRCILALGDNLFYGSQIAKKVANNFDQNGASIYAYQVDDVSPYGSVILNSEKLIEDIIEKPVAGGRGLAIPGLYHFDESVSERAATLKPSNRGETEIVELLKLFKKEGRLNYSLLDRGTAWLDTGTPADLNAASELIKVVQTRQGLLVGSPDEVAYRNGWISLDELLNLAQRYAGSPYGAALLKIAHE